jgi:hypothetical protein
MNELDSFAAHGWSVSRQRSQEQDAAPVAPRTEEPGVLMVAEVEALDGASVWTSDSVTTVTGPTGPISRVVREDVHEHFSPADYAPLQPTKIRVLHHHDRAQEIGQVEYLAWASGPDRIIAVCSIDAAAAEFWSDGDCYVSPGTRRDEHGRITLDHLGLCRSTARLAAARVKWVGTTFEQRSIWTPQTVPRLDLLQRADDARRKRARDAGIPIVGHPGFEEHPAELEERREPQRGESEYWRRNGENGLFFTGGHGRILDVK